MKDQILSARYDLQEWLDKYGRRMSDVLVDDSNNQYYINNATFMGRIIRVYLPEKYQTLDL